MNCQKDFIEYIDKIFYEDFKDISAIENSIDMFFEFFKKYEINAETVFLLKKIREKISQKCKSRNIELDSEDISSLASCFLGLILGKFSNKVKVPNYML